MHAELSKTPALGLTAYARTADVNRVRRAGFDGHGAKPVEAGALARAIAQLLAKR